MLAFIRKYFIASSDNNYRPYILRSGAVTTLLLVVIFSEVIFNLQIFVLYSNADFLAAILPDYLVDLTNQSRVSLASKPLKTNKLLEQAAVLKAKDMAEKGYFSHITPDGKTPWYWLNEVGYSFSRAGENLAVNFFDSKDVAAAWMDSPSHRENILNKNFTEIGIGLAGGKFENKDTVFIVQFFGTPLVSLGEQEVAAAVAPPPSGKVAPFAAPTEFVSLSVLGAEKNLSTKQKFVSFAIKFLPPLPDFINVFYGVIFFVIFAVMIQGVIKRAKMRQASLLAHGALVIAVLGSLLAVHQLSFVYNGAIF